jgi:hypothetical protein
MYALGWEAQGDQNRANRIQSCPHGHLHRYIYLLEGFMKKKISIFLNSPLGLLIIGFILTTLIGTFINSIYQKSSWNRTKNYEVLTRLLDKQEVLINDLSKDMNYRSYWLWKVFFILDDNWSSKNRKNLIDTWTKYNETVIKWNENLRFNKSRIRRLASEKLSDKFYQYNNNLSYDSTIYYNFTVSHNLIKKLVNFSLSNSKRNSDIDLENTQNMIHELDKSIDDFLNDLDIEFINNLKHIESSIN